MKKKVSVLFVALLCAIFAFLLTGCAKYDYANKYAGFEISVDKTQLSGELDQATVTVKATAKKDLDIMLGTSSLGKSGVVEIQCYMEKDGNKYELYSNEWDMVVTTDVYEFTLKSGESVERTLKFSRLPENYKNYEKYYSVNAVPQGEYRLRLCFNSDEWFDTDIVIKAD